MNDSEIVVEIRKLLRRSIDWYKDHKDDETYVYDCSIEHISENMTRSEAMLLLKFLDEEN